MSYVEQFEQMIAAMRRDLVLLHEDGIPWPVLEARCGISHATMHRFRREDCWGLSPATIRKIAAWLDTSPTASRG